jgi:hypothetical protein
VTVVTEQYREFLLAGEQRRHEDGARVAVITYLRSLGVDESAAAGAWIAVSLAVGRRAELIAEEHAAKVAARRGKSIKKTYDDEIVKGQLEQIGALVDAAVKAVEKASDYSWDHLAAEMTRFMPRAQFVADARQVRDSANYALSKLKRNGRPSSAKNALVDELAMIWRRATGKPPTASGEGTFDAPRSHFGKFVALAVTAVAGDFEDGFTDLLVNAVARHKKRNPKRVAKAS